MGLLPKPSIRRRSKGRFEINLPRHERELLKNCLEEFREHLMGQDPSLRRLFPVAYLKDEELEREYQDLTHGDLLEGRFAAIEVMESTLFATTVDEGELTAWMQSINSLRLVLGTRLDVSDEIPDLDFDDVDDPAVMQYVVYMILTELIHDIVAALSRQLPPPTDTDRSAL